MKRMIYGEWLIDRLERLALDALPARQPGHLAWGKGTVDFAADRRGFPRRWRI